MSAIKFFVRIGKMDLSVTEARWEKRTGLLSWRLCADNKPGREGTSHMSVLKTTNKPGNVNDLSETLSQLPRPSSP